MVKELTANEQDLTKGMDPLVVAEIDNYEKEASAFIEGGGMGDDFRPFRLQHGIYGQRQDDAQMVRVKIPHGTMTADQMDVLGDIADRFTPRKVGHVTTRQAFQFHYVSLEDSATGIEAARGAGVTVIAVPNPISRHQDLSAAHHHVNGLGDLSLEVLRALLGG